jgi:hypothetical protein
MISMTGEPRRSMPVYTKRETGCRRLNLPGKPAKQALHGPFLRETIQMPIFRLYSGSDGQSHIAELW